MKTKLLLLNLTAVLACGIPVLPAQDAPKPPPEERKPGGSPEGDAKARMEEFFKRLDSNTDGKVSKEEFVAHSQKEAEERFTKVDANSDGTIEKEELDAAARKLREGREQMRPPGGDGEGPRKRPDGDGDGARKRPEGDGDRGDRPREGGPRPEGFQRRPEGDRPGGSPDRPPGGAGMISEMLKRMDKDGDQTVSKEEFLKGNEERFDQMDANKDGKITKEEADAAAQKMREMMGGGGGPRRPDGEGGPRPRPEGDRPKDGI